MSEKIKVLIVDDHAIVRMGLASLLGTKPDLEVVGDAGDGATALRKYARLKPDVVIMDLVMPNMDGAETTRRLVESDPGAKVLILTSYGSAAGISAALQAGARGAVIKTLELAAFVAAIRKVAAGETVISDEVRDMLAEEPPTNALSPRQREILELLARGLANVEIATALGISRAMVKEHEIALYAKLGVANRTEAVSLALRKHLLNN